MRKLILFGSVLAVGLLGIWLAGGMRPKAPPLPTPVEPAQTGAILETQVPGVPDRMPVRIQGRATLDTYAEGENRLVGTKSRLEGIFKPLDPQFSRYEVLNLVMKVYDPVTNQLRETLQAQRGTFSVEQVEGALDLRITDGGRVQLEGVRCQRLSGHPFAPLKLRAARLELRVARDELRSVGDDLVQLDGSGITGSGTGLLFRGQEGLLRLERGGELVMDRGSGGTARFATQKGGPLAIQRLGDEGQGRIEVQAEDGARLFLEGPQAGQVTAQKVRVLGRVQEGLVVLEQAFAEGEVTAVRGEALYSGERARLDMEDGELQTLVLEEDPAAEFLMLDETGTENLIEVHGEGPLTVHMASAEPRFELMGPASAELQGQGLKVEAAGFLQGASNADRTQVRLIARDQVRASQGAGRLETDSLDAVFFAGEEVTSDFFCGGPTRVSNRDPVRGLISADVQGECELRVRGDEWIAKQARDVRVDIVGERPARFTAGLVRDLNFSVLAFEAQDGVTWTGAQGQSVSRTASLDPEGTLRLRGVSEEPARISFLESLGAGKGVDSTGTASISALEIEATETSFDARGGAAVQLEFGEDEASLRAEVILLETWDSADDAQQRAFRLDARAVTSSAFRSSVGVTRLQSDHLSVLGTLGGDGERLQTSDLVATGEVVVDRAGQVPVRGEGDWLIMEGKEAGRLVAESGRQVKISGRLPESETPYLMVAGAFAWSGESVSAARPTLWIDAPLLRRGEGPGGGHTRTRVDAVSYRFDERGLAFTGDVLAQGSDENGVPVQLRAGRLRLTGDFTEDLERAQWAGAVESVEAEGEFSLIYGGLGRVSGRRMVATRGRVAFWGGSEPARVIIGGPSGDFSLESDFIDLNLEQFLVRTTSGLLSSSGLGGDWFMRYAALEPRVVEGETMLALLSPRWFPGRAEDFEPSEGLPPTGARADFLCFWIHEEQWRLKGREALWQEPAADTAGVPAPVVEALPLQAGLVDNVFRRLLSGELALYLRAAYGVGNLEVTENGRVVSRAASCYLDMEKQEGHVEGATLIVRARFSNDQVERVRISAEHMRTAADGTLRAQKATLTTSSFDEPTYLVHTRELVLDPLPEGLWRLSALGNRLVFSNGLGLPLPSLGNLALSESGDVLGFVVGDGEEVQSLDHFILGDSARHGVTVGTMLRSDVGKIGRKVGRALGFGKNAAGDWHLEGSYLGSRGLLFGVGLELREELDTSDEEPFWFSVYTRGIHDDAADKGLTRVPVEDRSSGRFWTQARGRYPFSTTSWVDLAFSSQTDPGVQSEFYEREFQAYEERENYLHYRGAQGASYVHAMFKLRVDEYRTEIEQLPSVGVYGAETRLGALGGVDILYGSNLQMDSLRRLEGDLDYEFPFEDRAGIPDGLGDREVLRAHTSHTLSAPLETPVAGLRATPWVKGAATVWDRGVDDDSSMHRLLLRAGADLATTLHKRTQSGNLHSLSPALTFSTDLLREDSEEPVVRFDHLEDPVAGNEWGLGLRALWINPRLGHRLDLELKGLHLSDRGDGLEDVQQLVALSSLRTVLSGVPTGIRHDSRLDGDTGRTLYSNSTIALQPSEALLFEISYRRGLDNQQEELFEATSVDGRWRVDHKWEIELGQDISVSGEGNLRTTAALRRFSADFLLETVVENRAGEGGTSVSLRFTPLMLWRPGRLGMLER